MSRFVIESVRSLHAKGWQRGYEETAGPQQDVPVFRAWALAALLNSLRRQGKAYGRSLNLAPLEALASSWRARAGLPPREA